MLYAENSSMHHYIEFLKTRSHISKISRFHGNLYEISMSCWYPHFIMLRVRSYSNCKQFIVYCVSVVAMRVQRCSSSELSWHEQVSSSRLLATHYLLLYLKQAMSSLPYRVLVTSCGLSCQCSLDSLVTLLSNHFTRGKFASKCDVASEQYCMLWSTHPWA